MRKAILAVALLLLGATAARAHKPSDSYVTLRADGARLEGQWDIALRDLDYAIGIDGDADGAITWGELRARHAEIRAQLEARISRKLELDRFVETAAAAVGVSIAESSQMAPVEIDSYTQNAVEIKLRKVRIDQVARLMKELESNPGIVQVTRLNVNTRWGQNSELDIEMVVTTFERRSKSSGSDQSDRRRRKRGRS